MDIPQSSEPQTLIAACTAMLSRRRFSSCRDFALRVPRSDPYLSSSADQLLAIADVLSAADRRDWFSVLQLRPDEAADLELARQHFKKLALLLDPNTNAFPFSAEALTCLLEAWKVISDPQRRHLCDRELAGHPNPPPPPPPPVPPRSGTFWTACPYCWNMYEYEVACEDCALRCEGCRKVFHGVAVKPPVREETVVVEGERRQYYSCQASVPLKYCEVSEMKKGEEDHNMGKEDFIVISDDDDDVLGGKGVKGGGNVRNVALGRSNNNGRVDLRGSGNNNNSGKRRMRVKTVAKKAVGNRMRRRQQGAVPVADGDFDLDLGAGNGNGGVGGGGGDSGELEFTQGDDGDIFVGVRD